MNRFVIELMPNEDYAELHVSIRLTRNEYGSKVKPLTLHEEIMLQSLLDDIDGVIEANIHQYSVSLKIGLAFDRVSVCKNAAESIKGWLSLTSGVDPNKWEFGTVKRTDIAAATCSECQRVQDKMWNDVMRDEY